MPLETPTRRCIWFRTLTEPQIRALACQRKIKDWRTKSIKGLFSALEVIEGVEVPVQA